MHTRFQCADLFDAPSRLIDAVRQMGLALQTLRLERDADGRYDLHVALAVPDQISARPFLDRAARVLDLSLEDARA